MGNAVFTEFSGTLGNYQEMKNKIIDMGAGWERFAWITHGTPTCYDVVFAPVLEKIKKACNLKYDEKFFLKYSKISGRVNLDEVSDFKSVLSSISKQLGVSTEELQKNIEPLQALYSIADHARTLVFAIADGGLPSNVAGGYNLRVILRRALSFIDKFNWNLKLEDVADWHIDHLKKMFPEIEDRREEINTILRTEENRYKNTRERIDRIVQSLAGVQPTEEELIKLYDSEGITPEQLGVEAPSDFYSRVTERHLMEKPEEEKVSLDVSGLPKTKILYYDDVYKFKAKVLRISGNFVILDQTAFYPEQGGQKYDTGYIDNHKVIRVFKIKNVIVHEIEKSDDLIEGHEVFSKLSRS